MTTTAGHGELAHAADRLRECAEECGHCADACTETVTHCLELGGRHAEAVHVNLLLDCVAICRASATFLRHGSPRHRMTCYVCAEVCRACADDCERIGRDDERIMACAEACRRCADLCQEMADSTLTPSRFPGRGRSAPRSSPPPVPPRGRSPPGR